MITDPRIEFVGAALRSTDLARIRARLDSTEIRVRGDEQTAPTLLSLVNLLARIFPNIVVEAPTVSVSVPIFGNGEIGELAKDLVLHLRPSVPVSRTRTLVIDTGTGKPAADIYVAADAWTVALSRSPLAVCPKAGPAQAAASSLAAAEVFREVFPELPGVRLTLRPFFWNLLDYRNAPAVESVSPLPVEGVCFGAGSIGSSMLYALLLANATGHVAFIDPDRLSGRNRFRYPLWLTKARELKARWIERMANGSRITVQGFAQSAADFIHRHSQPIGTAIAAVDNVSARRDICDALARTTLNAGVDGLQFHVSRHHFGDGFACSYCQYVDLGELFDEAGMYMELTGLDERRVQQLLTGDRLTTEDLERMVNSNKLPPDTPLSELVGGRLQDALRVRLYEQAALPVTSGTLAVAAPFVSALAGSILAAELQKLAAGREDLLLNRRVDIDCSGFPTGFQSRIPEDSSSRCLCSNGFRRRKYESLWNG